MLLFSGLARPGAARKGGSIYATMRSSAAQASNSTLPLLLLSIDAREQMQQVRISLIICKRPVSILPGKQGLLEVYI